VSVAFVFVTLAVSERLTFLPQFLNYCHSVFLEWPEGFGRDTVDLSSALIIFKDIGQKTDQLCALSKTDVQ